MCKSVVQCGPVKGLQFFILTLARSILVRMKEREEGKKEESDHKLDEELQFNLQLLTEVICVKNSGVYRSHGKDILPWVEDICSVLDCNINLGQKDEYELAHVVLSGLLTWLCHIRLVETGDRVSKEQGRQWGEMVSPEDLSLDCNHVKPDFC